MIINDKNIKIERFAALSGTDLSKANLHGADPRETNLYGASLYEIKINDETQFTPYTIVPPGGKFIGYKKVIYKDKDTVITLEIPAHAKRVSTPVGRKCRAEYVKVLKGCGISCYGGIYKQGKIYRPDKYNPDWRVECSNKYNPDWRVECSNGVHFFLTPEKAAAYSI